MKFYDDVFISVCLTIDDLPQENIASSIKEVTTSLGKNFKFWELIFVHEANHKIAMESEKLLKISSNLRVLLLKPNITYYAKRLISASESIGDFVAIYSYNEATPEVLTDMIKDSISHESIIVSKNIRSKNILNWFIRSVSRSSGFLVNDQIMRTTILPRTYLNKILSNKDREIGIRYIPSYNNLPIKIHSLSDKKIDKNIYDNFSLRLSLLWKFLVLSAPRFLFLISFISMIFILFGIVFAFYSIAVILFVSEVQPGWFTTTFLTSISSTFVGIILFGLSISFQRLLDLLTDKLTDDVIEERSSKDFLPELKEELNINSTK